MLSTPSLRLLAAATLLSALACGDREMHTVADSQAAHVATVAASGGTVDSILPMDVQLQRFREGMTPPDTLRHAAPSREALVQRWLAAVASQDTSTLTSLLIDRAEFAFLYFPSSPMAMPPYETPPQLLWGQILASSNEGLPKVLNHFGGKTLAHPSLTCPDTATHEGANRTWSRCTLQFQVKGEGPTSGHFFGTIVERDGRFKFLGYANNL